MADLFDYKVAGYGFHVTAHLLALVALFVACFAITGYISFRDESIDVDKLNILNSDRDVSVVSITHAAGQEKWYYQTVETLAAATHANDDSIALLATGLPVGAVVVDTFMQVLTVSTLNLGALKFETGTAAECAVGSIPADELTNGAELANSTALAYDTGGTTKTEFAFTSTDNSICVSASSAALGNNGKVAFGVLIRAPPGVTLP